MSTIFAIRHGQASFLSDDYDRLSDLGHEQARRLGAYWARLGVVLDRVLVGPRRRHQETFAGLEEGWRATGRTWTATVDSEPDLDEYTFGLLLQQGIPDVAASHPEVVDLVQQLAAVEGDRYPAFQRLFEAVTRLWARGEIAVAGVETFVEFRARVNRAFARAVAAAPRGSTTALVTSGGPVGVITGAVLGLDDVTTLELSWMVRNAAYSEIRCGGGRRSLVAFGVLAHLDDPATWTYR